MEILNPPKSYIDYRCYTYGLSGPEVTSAQERFFRKNPDSKAEIGVFCEWLNKARNEGTLPIEQIVITKGNATKMMIFDVEYWIQGGKVWKRKLYLANQGQLTDLHEIPQRLDYKMQAAGEESEVPF